MARSNFVKAARNNIYVNGVRREYISEKGKKVGQVNTTLDRTIPRPEEEGGDTILIAKGESYYWWQFKGGGKRYSKTQPKPSQLTQNSFYQQTLGWQEQLEEWTADNPEDIEGMLDDFKSEVESLRDEYEEKRSNMEDNNLLETPSGEIVNERYEALDEYYNELDAIDVEYDGKTKEDIKEEMLEEEKETQQAIIDDYEDNPEESSYGEEDYEQALRTIKDIEGGTFEVDEDELDERYQTEAQEWISDKIDEIRQIELNV